MVSDDSDFSSTALGADKLLQSFPKASREVQERIKGVQESMAKLTNVMTPYVDLADRLRAYDEKVADTIEQLRQQIHELRTKNDRLSKNLVSANANIEKLTRETESLTEDNSRVQSSLHACTQERETANANLARSLAQISDLRKAEGELTKELTEAQNSVRKLQSTIADLEANQQEARKLQEHRDREAGAKMAAQKESIESCWSKKLDEQRYEYESKMRNMKQTCENALKEVEDEHKIIVGERNEFHARYAQLASELKERERRMKAECQRKLVAKFREFVGDWNRDQDAIARIPHCSKEISARRTENVAKKFLEDMQSVFGGDDDDRVETLPANRKKTAVAEPKQSRGTGISRDLIREAVGRVVNTRGGARNDK